MVSQVSLSGSSSASSSMSGTRALLVLLTSVYLLFSLYKFTPLSDHHPSPSPVSHHLFFQGFIEALTIFKSNPIEPISDNVISSPVALYTYEDNVDVDDNLVWPAIDENDVVVLTEKNFSQFVEKNKYVMVMFYAPWCYWSRKLAPKFEAAAQLLKGKAEAVFAMVDASLESRLGKQYHIRAYPTMYLFVNGVNKHLYDFENERTRDAIATWVKRKMAIGIRNITTMEEAVHIFNSEPEWILGVLDSLDGSDSEELAAASKMQTDINFYQTASVDVAELFLVVPQVKRPALILKQFGKYYSFDGQFTRSAIADFVFTRRLPPVITFTFKDAASIFENPLKQLWLFAWRNDSQVISTYEEVAEAFRGKLLFVHVELDNKSFGKQLAFEFGAIEDASTVVGYNSHDLQKHVFNGELTLSNIKCFAEDFLRNELLWQSDPASETVLKLPPLSHASHRPHLHI